ncbi:Transcription initiation factor TFIID subunit 1, putative, partial [Candida maltosa Xu316]
MADDLKGEAAYSQYVNSTDVPNDQVIESIFSERKTVHADDAIDYEDIDELADEEDDMGDLPMDENLGGDDGDMFDKLFEEGQQIPQPPPQTTQDQEQDQELGVEDETTAQAAADDQFDAIFGTTDELNGHEENNDEFFNDLGNGDQLLDVDNEGLDDLGELFDDEKVQKHKLEEDREEKRQLKKQKLQKMVKILEKEQMKRNIKHYFPTYSRHKPFNFHEFFSPRPEYFKYQRPAIAYNKNIKPLIPTKLSLTLDVDQRKIFKMRTSNSTESDNSNKITQADLDFIEALEAKRSSIDSFIKEIDYVKRDWTNFNKFGDYSKDLILSTTDWDDEAIINAGDSQYPVKPINERLLEVTPDEEEDDDEDIFNGQINPNKLKLDMNDPNLLFVPSKKIDTSKALVPTTDKLMELKFNISNDKDYELLRKNYNTKQRSQLSNLNIEHSVPALRLQAPYYKVKLSTDEMRSFHRPVFNIRPGTLISFSKLKLRKRKKDKGKSLQQVFSKTTDLTTTDTANLIALEYAEQYPPILSNFGMGSKLINYYRKERANDTSRPKAQVGETHILGVEDRSPFWNFGEVAPGDFVPTLYNNMVRAPIFKHEAKNTDFLLIKSQGAGSHQKFYLRAANFNFAVGNTFPVEVPAPHSRKVTNISKNRLKMIVFRVMNKLKAPRIAVKDVSKHFPEHTDMQNRQRLKEFMEYQRQGDDQGFWKVRGLNDVIPGEEEIRTMITPEDSSLMDTMQFGQQILDDNGMLFGDESAAKSDLKRKKDDKREDSVDEPEVTEENNDKDTNKKEKAKKSKEQDAEIDVEEELAPWNLSRNFVVANQTKTMLQLNGEGDPTGIGLGFSMLRATQKNPFKPLFTPPPENVPKSNAAAHNQKLYEQEIKRIWYSQRSSLVDHGESSEYNSQQIYNEYKPADHEQYVKSKLEQEDTPQVLRITRRVRDENGIVQRRVETLNDPRLIRAYIKRKKQIEDELLKNADVDEILPTNDKELNKIRRKALEEKLASLEKRAKQSRAKKPPKDSIHAAAAAGATIIDANTVMLPDG